MIAPRGEKWHPGSERVSQTTRDTLSTLSLLEAIRFPVFICTVSTFLHYIISCAIFTALDAPLRYN